MGLTKFPSGLSSMGMPLIGGGYITSGNVFFVDSVTGSNGNSGTDKDHPFADLDYAIGRCTGDKYDVIFLMPGHAENVVSAADINCDVAGVSIIGLGNGANRPTLTFTTATTATIAIGADDVKMQNLVIDLTGIDAVAVGIDVNATNFTLSDCRVIGADTAGQAVIWVDIGSGAHFTTIERCQLITGAGAGAATSGSQSIIHMSATAQCDYLTIKDSLLQGCTFAATINATQAGNGWLIDNNVIRNIADTGALAVEFGATGATNFGFVRFNHISVGTSTQSGALVDGGHWGDLGCYENYVTDEANDTSGRLAPVVQAC